MIKKKENRDRNKWITTKVYTCRKDVPVDQRLDPRNRNVANCPTDTRADGHCCN